MDIQFTTTRNGQDRKPLIVQVRADGLYCGILHRTGHVWASDTTLYNVCMGQPDAPTLDEAKTNTERMLNETANTLKSAVAEALKG